MFDFVYSLHQSVGSRAGFIYGSDVILPSLKVIYIINVITGLKFRHTNTFSVDIKNSNEFFLFPSTFFCLSWESRVFVSEAEAG